MPLPFDKQAALVDKKALEETFFDISYLRLLDNIQPALRGSVVIGDRLVHAYPSIGRLLSLQNGIKENFSAPFYAEEKIDGYNVRLFMHQGRILGLTRGGLICPFTSDRAQEWVKADIFSDHPDLVLCAEVAGPDTPYLESSPPFISSDVQLFVFDLMRINHTGFIPHDHAYALLEKYRLPTPQRLGRFELNQYDSLRDILIRFNQENREGLVFKEDSPRQKRAKYATANSCVLDIAATAHLLQDMPPQYFLERIWRSALFLQDMQLPRSSAFNESLGRAFVEGVQKAMHQFRETGKLCHRYRCRMRDKRSADLMVTQLGAGARRQHVHVRQHSLAIENGYWVLEFDREYPVTAGLLNHWLQGVSVFD